MDITTARKFRCQNVSCRRVFLADGDVPVGSVTCIFCGKSGSDIYEGNKYILHQSHKTLIKSKEKLIYRPRIVIKYNYGKLYNYSPIYIMGINPQQCVHGGVLLNQTIEALRETGILKDIDPTEIIELYYNHYGFLANCKNCTYYEIISKPAL